MGRRHLKSERTGEMWHVAPVSIMKGRDEGEEEDEEEIENAEEKEMEGEGGLE